MADKANIKDLSIEDKLKRLKDTTNQIEKQFGKGSVMNLNETKIDIERFKSGSILIDEITGGGYPKGRIIEIYGPESSGKTTLAIHAIAEIQKAGGIAAFCDAEQAFDPVYATNLGVDFDKMPFSQPDNGEEGLGIIEKWISSGVIDLVVVDSVAALVPQAELDGELGDQQMGLHARLMSKALRKLTPIAKQNNCTIIFLNQLREKIGVMYGNPETTTGGRALKFYSSVRIDIRKKEAIKDGSEIIGNKTRIKTAKNKTFPPFRECEIEIYYGKGIDNEGAVIDVAISKDISVHKSGAWFTYEVDGNELHKCQGKESMKKYFAENPEEFEYLKELINGDINIEEESE